MKLSNCVLSVVAISVASLAIIVTTKTIDVVPTAAINIPIESGIRGGGISIELPSKLSERQASLLTMAYRIAKRDGHQYPQLLQGIILQESLAGEHRSYKVAGQEFGLKANERYYGVAQIKLAATRDVLAKYPQLKKQFNFQTDTAEEVIGKLIENDEFNLTIASKYLLVLRGYGYDTVKQLALAYNQGPGGARNHDAESFHYSVGVMKYIQHLSPKKLNNRT